VSTAEQSAEARPKKDHRINVRVNFPISPNGPFHEKVAPETSAGIVKESAMSHFGVAEDGQHAYYLSHAGAKIPDTKTIGDLANGAKEIKLTLVKELIQG
jgi:hypothetical protein